jgi:hypothetical protein
MQHAIFINITTSVIVSYVLIAVKEWSTDKYEFTLDHGVTCEHGK